MPQSHIKGGLPKIIVYFLLGDEGDESDFGFNSRTIVFDLLDLDAPKVLYDYIGPTAAIDHNGYVKGQYLLFSKLCCWYESN